MNRIIIRGDISAPYQHLYIYKDGERVDSIGVLFDDLGEMVLTCLNKYKLTQVDLSGSRLYMEGIEKKIREYAVAKYDNFEINFKYV